MRQKALTDFKQYHLFTKQYGGPQSPKSWEKWKDLGDTAEFVKKWNEQQKSKRDRKNKDKNKKKENMLTPYVTNKLDQRNFFYTSLNGELWIDVRWLIMSYLL